jgi:hypothetical protein
MSHDFRPFDGTEKNLKSQLISANELKDVLQAIEEQQFGDRAREVSPYDEWVTVKSICEATGHSESEIETVLLAIRRENLASKVSERLRELEEPLYRVERPGHHKPDPSAPALRIQQINTILDRIMPEEKAKAKIRKHLEPTMTDRVASGIALIIGAIVVLVTIGLILQTMLRP